ncbi:MAG: LexA family protein [Bacilli bacterium]
MITNNLGQKIRNSRKKLNLTQSELSKKTEIPLMQVSRYERNVNEPDFETIKVLARALNVKAAWLLGIENDEQSPRLQKNPNPRFLPVLGTVSAGNLETPTELLDEQVEIPSFIKSDTEKLLVVRCNGDSMNQIIPDSYDIILIKAEHTTIKNGDIVVFKTENEYSVKRFYDMGDIIIFKPESHDESFKSIVIPKEADNQITVIGKALHVCMNLKNCDK